MSWPLGDGTKLGGESICRLVTIVQAGESIGDNSTDDDTLAVKVLVGR